MTEEIKMAPIAPRDLKELLMFAFAAALGKHPMMFTDEEKARWVEYSKRPVPLSTMQRVEYQMEVPRDEVFQAGRLAAEERLVRQMKMQRNRAAAANKNAARLFKDACEARDRARAAEAGLHAMTSRVPPHIRAMFKI